MQKKDRIGELDALRGIAALAVVLFHYTFKYNEEFGHTHPGFIFPKGHLGVELFFMISGYVIFMTVEKVKSTKEFIWLRFSRLFPVYWAAVIISFSAVAIFGLAGREISINAFLFNFTMLQDLFAIPSADGAYWSLLPELMFYVLMCFVLISNLKKQVWILSFIWLLFVIIHSQFKLPILTEQIFNLKYGMLFIAGIHFYKIKSKLPADLKFIALDILIIIMSLITCFIVYVDKVDAIVITGFFILFALLITNQLFFLRFKPLLFLGTISYPFYLVHQNIGYIVMNELNAGFWVELFTAIAITLALATLIHYLIEKPSLKYLRNK